MSASERRGFDRWIGPILALAALAAYLLTLSRGAYPGRSAQLVCEAFGLSPRLQPDHPVWFTLAGAWTHLPPAVGVTVLNLFSAVCGALSVWLLYLIVSGTVHATILALSSEIRKAAAASRIAGAASAGCLAFSTPFWIVSTRAHTVSLAILLLLLAAWFLCRYVWTDAKRHALFCVFLYGLAVVEYPVLAAFGVLLGGYILFVLYQRDELRFGRVAGLALAGLTGLAVWGLAAWVFEGSPGYALCGYKGWPHVLWIQFRNEYLGITRIFQRSGWLLVLLTTVVPWLAVVVSARWSLTLQHDWSHHALHIVMTALAAAIVAEVGFAPWRVLGSADSVVLPYLLTAVVFGYVLAWWFLISESARERLREGDMELLRTRVLWAAEKWGGRLVLVAGFGLLCVVPFRNVEDADGRAAAVVNRCATEIVQSLAGRAWLTTDGSLDAHLLLAARSFGVPLQTINLREDERGPYARYIRERLPSLDLKNRAYVGLLPLLRDWLATHSGVGDQLALLSMPDLWLAGGLASVPHRLVFLGTRDPSELDPQQLLAEHERFWSDFVPFVRWHARSRRPMSAFARACLRHTGRVANDLGVLLEELGEPDHAFQAYNRARVIDPNNVSALLNLEAMVKRGYPTDRARVIGDEAAGLRTRHRNRPPLWLWSRRYGTIRSADALAETAGTWARSGMTDLAAARLQQWREISGDTAAARQALADLHVRAERNDEGEELYVQLLRDDPGNQSALVGLARIAIRREDPALAAALLDRAQAWDDLPNGLALEVAGLYSALGDDDEARRLLDGLLEDDPAKIEAWAMLAGVCLRQNDRESLDRCVARLTALEGGWGFFSLVTQALKDLEQGKPLLARERLDDALTLQPANARVLEAVLRLDALLGRRRTTAAMARRLVAIDPQNAFGNYVVATCQMIEGDWALAEDSLRKSIRIRETAAALNDLAWVVQQRGAYQEAEAYVRLALQRNPRMIQAWDTLGVVLRGMGHLSEAEEAFDRAGLLEAEYSNTVRRAGLAGPH